MREQLGHVISTDRQLNDLNFLEIGTIRLTEYKALYHLITTPSF
jgi:hypothetical protein